MAPAMPKLKKAVKEFLGDVPPQDAVTLLGFNDNIFTLTRKATDPAERIKAVDRLAPWGSTALYDVLLRGVEMLGRQTGRKALIIFTDGEDQGSHATINDVERRLQSSDVTLYMIGQGRGVTMEPLKRIMERLSVPTGGRALFTDSIDELHAAFADLLDELSNQYLLGYQSSNSQARRCVAEDQGRRRRPPRRARAPGLPRAGGQMITIEETAETAETAEQIDRSLSALRSLRLCGSFSRCRRSSSRRRSRAFSRRWKSPRLTSGVVDDRGKPITNLTPADFVVRIDGTPRRVVSAEWVALDSDAGAARRRRRRTATAPTRAQRRPADRDCHRSAEHPLRRRAWRSTRRRTRSSIGWRRRIASPSPGFGTGAPSTPFTQDRERIKQAMAAWSARGARDDRGDAQHRADRSA